MGCCDIKMDFTPRMTLSKSHVPKRLFTFLFKGVYVEDNENTLTVFKTNGTTNMKLATNFEDRPRHAGKDLRLTYKFVCRAGW